MTGQHADIGGADLVGRVAGLRAYPVKSMDAAPVEQVRVLTSGLEHDRRWAVVDAGGDVVTARVAPALREVRVGGLHPDGPELLLPGADLAVRAGSADAALSALIGAEVTLRAATGTGPGFNEVAAVHLVSRQSIAAATDEATAANEATAGPDADADADADACSIEEPRANVVLELGPVPAGARSPDLETTWAGRTVRLGDEVVLSISQEPRHCLGVYARVVRPGLVSVGDGVRLG
jgi:uncharacterized protein